MNDKNLIHIGTSGWHYDHWRCPFYPENLAAGEFLKFYQEKFQTVEINNSFYRLPSEKALMEWRQNVPPGFIFAVKGSRYITHMKKLLDPEKSLAAPAGAGPAPRGPPGPYPLSAAALTDFDAERLRHFLGALPRDYRFALEFRDPGWLNGRLAGSSRNTGRPFVCMILPAGLLRGTSPGLRLYPAAWTGGGLPRTVFTGDPGRLGGGHFRLESRGQRGLLLFRQ